MGVTKMKRRELPRVPALVRCAWSAPGGGQTVHADLAGAGGLTARCRAGKKRTQSLSEAAAAPGGQQDDRERRVPEAIQAVVGHASIQLTFDVYGHLLPDDLDTLARRLGALEEAAAGDTGDAEGLAN